MNRWCIIATPRSGSTWLEMMMDRGVVNSLNEKDKKIFLNLGEYFLPQVHYNSKIDYELDKNSNFYRTSVKEIKNDNVMFFKKRLTLLKNNNVEQPLIVRLFPDNITWRSFNYFEFLDLLIEKKFKFVALYRDTLERIISWYLMDNTLLVHTFKNLNNKIEYFTKEGNTLNYLNLQKISIDMNIIPSYITRTAEENPHFNELVKYVNCPILSYDSLIHDCNNNNIPIDVSVSIVKNYDMSYQDLISNFSEVKEFYESFISNS